VTVNDYQVFVVEIKSGKSAGMKWIFNAEREAVAKFIALRDAGIESVWWDMCSCWQQT
jgi:hypothetical protein